MTDTRTVPTGQSRHRVTLSTRASDRASAYPMSPKIARLGAHYACTYLDSDRQNHCAVVDAASGEILADATVGPARRDNHCGAAVLNSPDGTLHLLVGGHHEEFMHYRVAPRAAVDAWQQVDPAVGRGATYPSAVFDGDGTLHLSFRCRGLNGLPDGVTDSINPDQPFPYHVMYARWSASRGWDRPVPLVQVAELEHTWTMHGLTIDAGGTLHLAHVCTLPLANGDKSYGAAHLFSKDRGTTWMQVGSNHALPQRFPLAELERIEGREQEAERTEFAAPLWRPTTPIGSYYNQMTLSNPLALRDGTLLVLLHNQLSGTIDVCRLHGASGRWTRAALPLAHVAPPNYRFINLSSITQHKDGAVEAVCTIAPSYAPAYGHPRTALLRYLWTDLNAPPHAEFVREPLGNRAAWLPSLEHSANGLLGERPALLYTLGRNAGNNYTDEVNEVVLEIPE